jgi:hypothetical protein
MVLKNAIAATAWIAALALGSPASAADQYRPDEFLSLDLSKALLSPKPLGPPTEFAPVPVEAKSDRGAESAQVRVELKPEHQKVVRTTRITANVARVTPKVRQAHAERPRAAARPKLARRHGNPLDAHARDTRIQVWPCKSGGICNWQR